MDAFLQKALATPEIKQFIEKRNWRAVRDLVEEWPVPEVADLLLDLPKTERVLLFRALSRKQAAGVFAYLGPADQEQLFFDLTDEEGRQVLRQISPDDRAGLMTELPASITQRAFSLLEPEDLEEVRSLLGYPEESAGRLMTPDYVALRPEWTVQEAINHTRKVGKDSETINRVYVVDEDGHLVDDLSLRSLILAAPERPVEEIMDHTFVSVSAFTDREEAVQAIQRYDVVALPVLDSEGILLGIVTVDDLLDVAEEEATEDFHKLGGMEALEYPYLSTTVPRLVRKRIGWLAILFAAGLGTAAAMAHFEEAIDQLPLLAVFVPLIIATGGNSGFQAATVMTRAMALREVEQEHWRLVFGREMTGGLLLGGLLAVIGFVLAAAVGLWMYHGVAGVLNLALDVGFAVAMSVVAVVLFGNLVGSMLPFILQRLGIDPATSSTPFVATVVDIVGLILYFTIATWWMDMEVLTRLSENAQAVLLLAVN